MFKRLFCRLLRHHVNRRRVWNDQINFRTNCTRCGAPLLRDQRGWREFESERDASMKRDPHPRSFEPGSN